MNRITLSKALPLLLLSLLFSGCSSTPQSQAARVQVSPQQQLSLPSVDSLGYQLSASQLIEATWNNGDKPRSEQLPVQLQVSDTKLVLAGFSSWGTRILSLTYQDQQVTTEVLAGLNDVLPPAEQVLFNLMVTLWPSAAWEASLSEVRWRIEEGSDFRTVFDDQGEKVIEIEYSNRERLNGPIKFRNLLDDYSITITTLQFQKSE